MHAREGGSNLWLRGHDWPMSIRVHPGAQVLVTTKLRQSGSMSVMVCGLSALIDRVLAAICGTPYWVSPAFNALTHGFQHSRAPSWALLRFEVPPPRPGYTISFRRAWRTESAGASPGRRARTTLHPTPVCGTPGDGPGTRWQRQRRRLTCRR